VVRIQEANPSAREVDLHDVFDEEVSPQQPELPSRLRSAVSAPHVHPELEVASQTGRAPVGRPLGRANRHAELASEARSQRAEAGTGVEDKRKGARSLFPGEIDDDGTRIWRVEKRKIRNDRCGRGSLSLRCGYRKYDDLKKHPGAGHRAKREPGENAQRWPRDESLCAPVQPNLSSPLQGDGLSR
jgi:hypothetical protein